MLVGPRGHVRVTQVSTVLWSERTPKGIGPGSIERDLLGAYPGVRCTRLRMENYKGIVYLATLSRTCTLVTSTGRRTIFETEWVQPKAPRDRPSIKPSVQNYSRYARVGEVIVEGAL